MKPLISFLLLIILSSLPSPTFPQQPRSIHESPSLVALAPPSLGPEPSSAAGGAGGRPASLSEKSSPFNLWLPPFAPISPDVPGERCRSDSHQLLKELKSMTLWAAEMFDASAKFPTGLLHGSTMEAGNYDECMSVAVPESSGISSKYCLSTIRLRLPPSLIDNWQSPTIWNKIKNSTIIPSHKHRDLIKWGLCIPASCNALDLQTHLKHVLEPFAEAVGGSPVVGTEILQDNGPAVSVFVDEIECQRSDVFGANAPSKPFSKGEIAVGCIYAIAFLLLIIGTGYDVIMRTFYDGVPESNKQGPVERYIMCFSSYSNGLKLFREGKNTNNPLLFINGAKFYSICLIIMGHRIFYSLGGPIMNSEYVEQFYTSFEVVILLGGPVVVDTFFTITGCLLTYLLLSEYEKYKSRVSLTILYINRFIRLTPLYMAILAVYATFLPRISSGPLWTTKVYTESRRCTENWWTNLLYINSFVKKEEMCMLQSWYLSCDMHLFIIGAPVALLIAKRPNLGKVLLWLLVAISAIVPFVLTLVFKWEPLFPIYMETVKELLASETYLTIYIPTYMRAAPYFIGMCVGYIIYEHRARKVTVSVRAAVLGYAFCITAMLSPIFGSWAFYSPEWKYDALSSAFYSTLHRISWSCGISSGIYFLTTDYGWLFGRFLGWKRIYPLGRLTYSAFLVHCFLQLIDVGSQRTGLYLSIYSMTLSAMADILLSFLLGFGLSLLFEAPILSLLSLLLASKVGKKEEEAVVSNVMEEVKIGRMIPHIQPPPYHSQHDNPSWINDEGRNGHIG